MQTNVVKDKGNSFTVEPQEFPILLLSRHGLGLRHKRTYHKPHFFSDAKQKYICKLSSEQLNLLFFEAIGRPC